MILLNDDIPQAGCFGDAACRIRNMRKNPGGWNEVYNRRSDGGCRGCCHNDSFCRPSSFLDSRRLYNAWPRTLLGEAARVLSTGGRYMLFSVFGDEGCKDMHKMLAQPGFEDDIQAWDTWSRKRRDSHTHARIDMYSLPHQL